MFTVNQVLAAPVVVSKAHLEVAEPQAIVINSGVANAATGERGELDALATAAEAGRLLDLDAEEVLVLSTGVIGTLLPLDKVLAACAAAAPALSPKGGADAAEAILTTDTRTKEAAVSLDGFTVGGMAKGSGMIHPQLATMLAVVTTDYPLEPGEAIDFLRPAVDRSFNSISVDGECSTNDAVCLLANGASRDRADAGLRHRLRARARPRLRASSRSRSSPTARVRPCSPRSRSPAPPTARRHVRSPRGSPPRRSSRPRSSATTRTGAACSPPPARRRTTAASRPSTRRKVTLSYNGTTVLERGAPSGVEPDVSNGVCRIELDLGLGERRARAT